MIDGGVSNDNDDAVDAADANALYRLLEEEVVPAFYDRDPAGIPHRWLATVKESIRSVAPRFSARRMVKEYVERMYAPAHRRRQSRRAADVKSARRRQPLLPSDLVADRRMVNDLDRGCRPDRESNTTARRRGACAAAASIVTPRLSRNAAHSSTDPGVRTTNPR